MSIEMPQKSAAVTVLCHACSAENAGDRKFCGGCGQQLWQHCAACSARSPMGVKFCGECGAKLEEAFVDRLGQHQQTFDEARELIGASHFEEAQRMLRQLLREVDPAAFSSLYRQIETQLEFATAESERQTQEATAAYEAAQLYLADRDYERARHALESVALPIRDEDFTALLDKVREYVREIGAIELEIRQAIQERQTGGLLPKVERLLELVPDHADGQKLATMLREKLRADELKQRERLCRSAKESIANFDYAEALEQLKLVPLATRDDDFQKLYDFAEELAWLMNDLRSAPIVDSALLEVARRLIKLQPGNRQPAELLEEMQRRLRGERKDPRQAAPGWARAPKRTLLQIPIEWLGGFARLLPVDTQSARTLAEHPGQFHIAAGLALQGLDRSCLAIDLLPKEDEGLLSRFSTRRKSSLRNAWGVDVGPTSVKAIKLQLGKNNEPEIAAVEWIEHEKNLSRPDAEGLRGELVTKVLRQIVERRALDLKTERFCVGVPGNKTLGRFFKLPAVKANKVAEAMLYEAQHQIPLPLETLTWDYQPLNLNGEEPKPGQMTDYVLLAAKLGELGEYLEPFADLGMQVVAVQSDCLALYNALHYEFWAEGADAGEEVAPESTVMVLDMGSDSTNVLMAGPRRVWFRTIARGGDDFTKRLMREFNLTFDRAEQLKRNPALSRFLSKHHDALLPAFQELEKELNLTISSFASYLSNQGGNEAQQPANLLGLGGGFQLHGLLRYLRMGQ